MSEEFVLMDDDLFYKCDRYQEYTERATAVPSGQKINSDIHCDCLTDDGQYCYGTVQLQRLDVPKEIRWECQKCGDRGAVINFENTYWDKSSLSAEEKEQYLNRDYDDLFDLEGLDDDRFAEDIMASELDNEELQELGSHLFGPSYPKLFEEVMGLSEDALFQLFSSDWEETGAPLYIRADLSFEEANQSLIFYNARSFLQLLVKQESFIATNAGNLKRETVNELTEVCRWPEGYMKNIHEYNKVLNEQDVWLLHELRILLDLAGLIREKKGCFLPVKKRLHLTEKEHTGELYQRLFCTNFRKMNMAYRSSDFAANIQDALPYSFYRLHQHPTAWNSPEQLFKVMLLPADQWEIESRLDPSSEYNPGVSTLEYSLLKPLVHFGILEKRLTDEKDPFGLRHNHEYRKSPLFDKVVIFNIQ